MIEITANDIHEIFDYQEFVPILRRGFCEEVEVPDRLHYDFENGVGDKFSTLLLMPAWRNKQYLGLKTITVSPHNDQFDLQSVP